MADIELVIKLDEEYIKQIDKLRFLIGGIEDRSLQVNVINAIKTGTPLPKGHGVLKDVTNLMRGLYTDIQTIEETFTSSEVYKMIDEECPTIIEADRGIDNGNDN